MSALRGMVQVGLNRDWTRWRSHPVLVRTGVWAVLVLVAVLILMPLFDVSLEDTLVRATPFVFTGLAVAVPARAGLVNIGGEGQFSLAMVGVTGVLLLVGQSLPAPLLLPLLAIVGVLGGMLWAGIAAGL